MLLVLASLVSDSDSDLLMPPGPTSGCSLTDGPNTNDITQDVLPTAVARWTTFGLALLLGTMGLVFAFILVVVARLLFRIVSSWHPKNDRSTAMPPLTPDFDSLEAIQQSEADVESDESSSPSDGPLPVEQRVPESPYEGADSLYDYV
jgi:hypothetical protein